MRGLFGISAALMAVAIQSDPFRHVDIASAEPDHPRSFRKFKEPQNSGPVIDTTRESKRAKRRRLARSTA